VDPGETLGSGDTFIPIEIGTATTGASSLFIRDLAVVGNFSVINPVAKYIQGIGANHNTTPAAHSDDITIERVRVVDVNAGIYSFKDGTEGAARTGSRHQRWLISECQVEDAQNKAFELQEAEDSAIINCTTIDCADGAQVHNYTVRSRIADNRMEYKDSGVNVTHGSSDIEVTGNVLTATTGGGVGFQGGIVIRQEAYAAAGPTSARVYIHHNLIRDHVTTDQCGIRFASYTMNTGVGVFDDYTIANNVFDVGGDSYLYDDEFPAKTSATGLRIFDNIFKDNALTSGSWSSDNTRVYRNRFETNHTANSDDWHYRHNDFLGTFTVVGAGITTADAGTVTEADVRDAGRWEPVTDGDVAATELVFEDGDVVMEWVTG
jgi:hypothetical protein